MARSRGSRRQPGAGSAHRRESWVPALEIGTGVGDPRAVQLQRTCVCPTCVHKSNACAGVGVGLQRLRRCVRWPTGVRVGYTRWRSVQALEIRGPCNSNVRALVQCACITPTPAQGWELGGREMPSDPSQPAGPRCRGGALPRRLSPFRPNRSDRKSRRVSSSSRPLSDA